MVCTLCLDGTLNASVLAALASDAVGPTHVHVVVGSSAGAAAASCRELAHRLRVDTVNAPAPMRDYDARDLDELELSMLARAHGALVLSSVDKTALALGMWRILRCNPWCRGGYDPVPPKHSGKE